MVYVALLRGINVGGNSKVEMTKLKALFEELGFEGVKTYINSGNVIFKTGEAESGLVPKIEVAIEKQFGLQVSVVVRDLPAIEKLVKAIPNKWVNNQDMRCDVMFLWPAVDNPQALKAVPSRPEIEDVKYFPGAVVWRVDRDKVRQSRVPNLIGMPLYKQMTARNINTVRKLYELMTAV